MTENFCIFSSIFLAIPHKIYRFAPILKRIHTHFVPQLPVKTDKIEKKHPKKHESEAERHMGRSASTIN